MVEADECRAREACNRHQMAMTSYAPLFKPVIGSRHLRFEIKNRLFFSLVISRLMYNLHTLTITTPLLKQLDDMYIRGIRMIRDCSRFDATAESDLTIRLRYSVRSSDCLVVKAWLRHLRQSVQHRPQTVI